MMVEIMGGREGHDPQSDYQGTDGEDPATRRTVMVGEGRRFASSEYLATDADAHQKNAEDEGGPRHGLTFVPHKR